MTHCKQHINAPHSAGAANKHSVPLLAFQLSPPPSQIELSALHRLIRIAQGVTGQSGYVADFLLAWWDAASFGGFDFTSLWAMDLAIAADMQIVFGLICRVNKYPDALGLDTDFEAIIRIWRTQRR